MEYLKKNLTRFILILLDKAANNIGAIRKCCYIEIILKKAGFTGKKYDLHKIRCRTFKDIRI